MGLFKDRELEKRYEYIAESSDLTRYGAPPPRAKYQAGDIVVARGTDTSATRFYVYHTKGKYEAYYSKPGEVVGYYNYPGAYTKYSVKFEDGKILTFHSNFLIGPFKTLQIAKTYQDESKQIVPADIKLPGDLLETWQIKPNFEKAARDILTQEPYNYTWHEEPREVERQGNNIIFELARRTDNYVVLRTNNYISKKLATNGYRVVLPPNYCNELFINYVPTNPFSIYENPARVRETQLWSARNISGLQDLKALLTPETKRNYKTNFKLTETDELTDELFLEMLQPYLETTDDGYRLTVPFDEGHDKRLHGRTKSFVFIPQALRNCSSLKKMTIVGDVGVYGSWDGYGARDRSIDLIIAPQKIIGTLTFYSTLKNFDNMPKVVGEIVFSGSDKANYVTHLAGKHYKDYEDLLS